MNSRKILGPVAFAALVLLGALAGKQAEAQGVRPPCRAAGELTKLLSQEFDETPVAVGIQANGDLVQVFATKDGNTWSIVTTRPDGISCIVALGEHWEALPPVNPDPMA